MGYTEKQIGQTPKYPRVRQHYIYLHRTPEGEIVYIGKGSGKYAYRAYHTERHNDEHTRLLTDGLLDIEIMIDNLRKYECHRLEADMINSVRPIYNTLMKS